MNLTGKSKQDFEAWFPVGTATDCVNTLLQKEVAITLHVFYQMPLSMQFGVVQEWADSVGIRVDITVFYDQMLNYTRGYELKVNDTCYYYDGDVFETRKSAQIAAISKLNEIYNEQ